MLNYSIKIKSYLILYVFLLSPFIISSQNKKIKIDNLIKKYDTTKNLRKKITLLDSICTDDNDTLVAVNLYKKYYKLSFELKSPNNIFRSTKFLSDYYFNKGDYSRALQILKPSIIFFKNKKDVNLMKLLMQAGKINNRIDEYKKAEYYYLKSLETYNNLSDNKKKKYKKYLAVLYARLGILYKNLQNNQLADEYNIKSFEISKEIKDYMRVSHFYASQGWIYVSLKNYKKAEKYFKLSIQDSSKIKTKIYVIAGMHGLGYVLGKEGKYQKALYYDSIALNYFRKTNNKLFTNAVLNNMSEVYLSQKQYNKASNKIQEAIDIAKKYKLDNAYLLSGLIQAKIFNKTGKNKQALDILKNIETKKINFNKMHYEYKIDFYKLMADLNYKQKKYKKSSEMLYNAFKYQDSFLMHRLKNFSDLETKYKLSINKKNLIKKELQLKIAQKQKKIYITLIIIIILILLILFYIIFSYYNKLKNYKIKLKRTINDINDLKEKLFKNTYLEDYRSFRKYLMSKYDIDKVHIIEIWESIASGESRKDFAKKTKISENTIKKYRIELYKKIKKKLSLQNQRLGDYKVVIEYYQSLLEFEKRNYK